MGFQSLRQAHLSRTGLCYDSYIYIYSYRESHNLSEVTGGHFEIRSFPEMGIPPKSSISIIQTGFSTKKTKQLLGIPLFMETLNPPVLLRLKGMVRQNALVVLTGVASQGMTWEKPIPKTSWENKNHIPKHDVGYIYISHDIHPSMDSYDFM